MLGMDGERIIYQPQPAQLSLAQPHQPTQILHLIGAKLQPAQAVQPGQRRHIRHVVIPQPQRPQVGQPGQRTQILHVVVPQMQHPQVDQARQRRHIRDPISPQLQRIQRRPMFEAVQASNDLIVRFYNGQRIDVRFQHRQRIDVRFGQRTFQLIQRLPHRLLQRFVGKRQHSRPHLLGFHRVSRCFLCDLHFPPE